MTKEKAREIVKKYIEKHGEIPSTFSDLQLAKAILLLEDEIEEIVK